MSGRVLACIFLLSATCSQHVLRNVEAVETATMDSSEEQRPAAQAGGQATSSPLMPDAWQNSSRDSLTCSDLPPVLLLTYQYLQRQYSHRFGPGRPGCRRPFKPGSTCRLMCPTDFTADLPSSLEGVTMACQITAAGKAEWMGSPRQLHCYDSAHVCPEPPKHEKYALSSTLLHSAVLSSNLFLVNDLMTFSCQSGHNLVITHDYYVVPFVGGRTQCLYPGIWSQRGVVMCLKDRAPPSPATIPKATVQSLCREAPFPQRYDADLSSRINYICTFNRGLPVCQFQCSHGYESANGRKVWSWVCYKNRKTGQYMWVPPGGRKPELLVCRRRACGHPATVFNGEGTVAVKPSNSVYRMGDSAHVTCTGSWSGQPARRSSGNVLVKMQCMANGMWSLSNLTCLPNKCGRSCSISCESWLRSPFSFYIGRARGKVTKQVCQGMGNVPAGGQLLMLCDNTRHSECQRYPFNNVSLEYQCSGCTGQFENPKSRQPMTVTLDASYFRCRVPEEYKVIDGLLLLTPRTSNCSLANGTHLSFRCKPGYVMHPVQSHTLTCVDGRWSPAAPPLCFAEASCDQSRPSLTYFGHHPSCTLHRNQHTGTSVVYLQEICSTRCESGQLGNGVKQHWSLRCSLSSDGSYHWQHENISCAAAVCPPPPPHPSGGDIAMECANMSNCTGNDESFASGTQAVYSCMGGWEGRGSMTAALMCGSGGRWIGRLPACRLCHACKLKARWLNGNYRVSMSSGAALSLPWQSSVGPGQQITVSCLPGNGDILHRSQCYDELHNGVMLSGTMALTRRWREIPVRFSCICDPSPALRPVSQHRGLQCHPLPRHLRDLQGNCIGPHATRQLDFGS